MLHAEMCKLSTIDQEWIIKGWKVNEMKTEDFNLLQV